MKTKFVVKEEVEEDNTETYWADEGSKARKAGVNS
jgi:hypothetical protein